MIEIQDSRKPERAISLAANNASSSNLSRNSLFLSLSLSRREKSVSPAGACVYRQTRSALPNAFTWERQTLETSASLASSRVLSVCLLLPLRPSVSHFPADSRVVDLNRRLEARLIFARKYGLQPLEPRVYISEYVIDRFENEEADKAYAKTLHATD